MAAVVFFAVIGFALIPMFIAREKGRKNLALWFLLGIFAPLVSIVVALILEQEYPCSNCGHNVRESAVYCAACGVELPKRSRAPAPSATPSATPTTSMTPMQREVLRRRPRK